jgi:acetolactate synthase-1/3 small subunit
VNVVEISELDPRHSVERELMLATVSAKPEERGQIIELVQIFEGRIIAVAPDELTVSLEDHPTKVDDFEEMLRPFGLVEIGRSGRVALPRIGHDHEHTSTDPAHHP